MLRTILLITFALAFGACLAFSTRTASAQPGAFPGKEKPQKLEEKLIAHQKNLTERFKEFMNEVSRVKEEMENGTEEEKLDAKVLMEAIKTEKDAKIAVQFQELAKFLKPKNLSGPAIIKEGLDKTLVLSENLTRLLALVRQEVTPTQFQTEKAQIKKLLNDLAKMIQDQKTLQKITALQKKGSTENKELQEAQKGVAKQSQQVLNNLENHLALKWLTRVKKQIIEVKCLQEKALIKIELGQTVTAAKDQEQAVEWLEKATKEMTNYLPMLRHQELNLILATLANHCETATKLQTSVRYATEGIAELIKKNNNQIETLHKKQALDQSNKEKEILQEVVTALKLAQSDTVHADIAKALKQLQAEMKTLSFRLEAFRVAGEEGTYTIALENEVLKNLNKVQDDLQKGLQENKKKIDTMDFPPPHPKYAKLITTLEALVRDQDQTSQEWSYLFKLSIGGPLLSIGNSE